MDGYPCGAVRLFRQLNLSVFILFGSGLALEAIYIKCDIYRWKLMRIVFVQCERSTLTLSISTNAKVYSFFINNKMANF